MTKSLYRCKPIQQADREKMLEFESFLDGDLGLPPDQTTDILLKAHDIFFSCECQSKPARNFQVISISAIANNGNAMERRG